MYLLLDPQSQMILAYGVLEPGVGQRVVVYDGPSDILQRPGRKYFQADGTIAVTPPTAEESGSPAPPPAVKQAWQTLSQAAQTDQNMQAIKVLFRYLNSQLS